MYFETCFFLIIDWFIWFARVPLKNRKKLGNKNFLNSNMLVLRILLYLRNYSFSGISFFIKVDQQKRCRPTICNSTTISDYINICPYRSLLEKSAIWICLITWNKRHSWKQVVPTTNRLKKFFAASIFKGLWVVSFQTVSAMFSSIFVNGFKNNLRL